MEPVWRTSFGRKFYNHSATTLSPMLTSLISVDKTLPRTPQWLNERLVMEEVVPICSCSSPSP